MFHMPMSSPMMTTMLGFCDCWATAGKLVVANRIVEASAAGINWLIVMGPHPSVSKVYFSGTRRTVLLSPARRAYRSDNYRRAAKFTMHFRQRKKYTSRVRLPRWCLFHLQRRTRNKCLPNLHRQPRSIFVTFTADPHH